MDFQRSAVHNRGASNKQLQSLCTLFTPFSPTCSLFYEQFCPPIYNLYQVLQSDKTYRPINFLMSFSFPFSHRIPQIRSQTEWSLPFSQENASKTYRKTIINRSVKTPRPRVTWVWYEWEMPRLRVMRF